MSERALVIEPEPPIAKLLALLLRREFGFDVVTTRTITEGVSAMREGLFKAVIADISISADGIAELTAETRKQKSGVVVLTTGRIDRGTLELFVSDDVYAVFPKPFDIDEVMSSLRDAIEFAQAGSTIAARLHGFLKDRLKQES